MCKSTGYITEEFCQKYQIGYRSEVAQHTAVPIALGMVLSKPESKYGTPEWRAKLDQRMLEIYLRDCKLYDRHKKDDEDWAITRKKFYSPEGYP